ncbi:MAG: TIGR00159 family protein [Clostridiales bacterium]|nr:TIGR00159 family protein [Clostridiales bacterium]
MSELSSAISDFFANVRNVFFGFNFITDILDILFVTFLIYSLVVQLRKSQSIQVIKGLILVAVIYAVVHFLGMQTSEYIFNQLFSNAFLIAVIVFAPEIRQALEHVGRSNLGNFSLIAPNKPEAQILDSINAVVRACSSMSRDKIGSLIIFQRKSYLGELTNDSVTIDAVTTPDMVLSIFYPKSSMHDGAIVIKDGRITAARCIVPMRNDRELSGDMGTRHRAALEVSIKSDAIAVVTSEETGIISIAVDGQLWRGLKDSELRERLTTLLLPSSDSKDTPFEKLRGVFERRKKNEK